MTGVSTLFLMLIKCSYTLTSLSWSEFKISPWDRNSLYLPKIPFPTLVKWVASHSWPLHLDAHGPRHFVEGLHQGVSNVSVTACKEHQPVSERYAVDQRKSSHLFRPIRDPWVVLVLHTQIHLIQQEWDTSAYPFVCSFCGSSYGSCSLDDPLSRKNSSSQIQHLVLKV